MTEENANSRAPTSQHPHDKNYFFHRLRVDPNLLFQALLTLFTFGLIVVGGLQWCTLDKTDQTLKAGQRPWLSTSIFPERVMVFEDGGQRGINLMLHFFLKNYGHSPATNIRIVPDILPHPGNPRASELDKIQSGTCEKARARSAENEIGGITIFPGETNSPEIGVGTSGVYRTANDAILFSVLGCIDYTHDGGHGETGFRMLLGQIIEGKWAGLPFKEGSPWPTDDSKVKAVFVNDFRFSGDPSGGNYAK